MTASGSVLDMSLEDIISKTHKDFKAHKQQCGHTQSNTFSNKVSYKRKAANKVTARALGRPSVIKASKFKAASSTTHEASPAMPCKHAPIQFTLQPRKRITEPTLDMIIQQQRHQGRQPRRNLRRTCMDTQTLCKQVSAGPGQTSIRQQAVGRVQPTPQRQQRHKLKGQQLQHMPRTQNGGKYKPKPDQHFGNADLLAQGIYGLRPFNVNSQHPEQQLHQTLGGVHKGGHCRQHALEQQWNAGFYQGQNRVQGADRGGRGRGRGRGRSWYGHDTR